MEPALAIHCTVPRTFLSSLATEWLKGKSVTEAQEITNKQIATELKLPPVKLHCSMLAADAIQAAVKDLEAKRADA